MALTPDQIQTVQGALIRMGLQISPASGSWTAPACEAYKQYQLRKGVPYPNCQLLPSSVAELNEELRALLSGAPRKAPEAPKAPAPEPVVEEQAAATEPSSKVDTAIRIPKKKKP